MGHSAFEIGRNGFRMNEYFIAWWNVENLFSIENDPNRHPWLDRYLGRELAGWDADVLQQKISQLASVITRMNDGLGPDLLGVCEVENEAVLNQLVDRISLPGRSYRVIHHDSGDKRGIDVAFIYDSKRFRTRASEVFHHIIQKRTATRDLCQVNFYTRPRGNLLICIGNHWPARTGGVLESEPYRMLAGETLSYWMTRIHQIFAEQAVAAGRAESESKSVPPPVLVMGDFNDEPFNRALTHYALAQRIERKVKSRRSKNPYLLNLMWPLMGSGHVSYMYEGQPHMLDQILVNRGLLDRDSPLELSRIQLAGRPVPHVGIVKFEDMQIQSGSNRNGPKRFGRPARHFDPEGYSDHFPVAIKIREKHEELA